MATNYYCIRKIATLEDGRGLVFDNYPGANFPKFRTRREAVEALKEIAADILAEGADVLPVMGATIRRDGRRDLKGLRFSDGFQKYAADIFRHDAEHIRGAAGMSPAEMGVTGAAGAVRTYIYEKFTARA